MLYIFDSIRSVWLKCLVHQKNWLFRITFLTVFAVCGLDASNTKKTGHLVLYNYNGIIRFLKTQRFMC